MKAEENSRAREILSVATRLFAQKGFDGVSVRDICAEMDVNCSIISYYYKGKMGLYQAVLRSLFEVLDHCLSDAAQQNPEGEAGLRSIFSAMAKLSEASPYFSAIFLREWARPSPEFQQLAAEYGPKHDERLTVIIRQAQRQGLFRADLRAEGIIPVLKLLLAGAGAATSGGLSEAEYFKTAADIFLAGLCPQNNEEGKLPGIGKQSARPRGTFGR